MPNISGLVSSAVKATTVVGAAVSTVNDVKGLISSFKKATAAPADTVLKARSIASIAKKTGTPGLASGSVGDSIKNRIEANRKNLSVSFYEYPSVPAPYEMQFNFIKYQKGTDAGSGRDLIKRGTRDVQWSEAVNQLVYKSIILPIPTNLVSSIGLSYDQFDQGVFGGNITAGLTDLVSKISEAGTSAIKNSDYLEQGKNIVKSVSSSVIAAAQSIDASIIEAFIRKNITDETIGGIIGQTLGNIPNPNRTVQFNGVELRSFEYSWKFAPHTPQESFNLKEIIRQFQLSSLPEKSGNWFLNYPDVVVVKFLRNFNAMYEHKICFIESINVNYAPSGQPAFFHGTNEPVELELAIRLREASIMTREDVMTDTELNIPE